MSNFENELKLSLVEAAGWRDALFAAGHLDEEAAASMPDTYREAQTEAFNQDWHFAVEEVNR